MISESVLQKIVDTEVTQTFTILVKLDVEKTDDAKGQFDIPFRPKEITAVWNKANGHGWKLVSVELRGLYVDNNGDLINEWSAGQRWTNLEDVHDHQMPAWVFEIVDETKPKD